MYCKPGVTGTIQQNWIHSRKVDYHKHPSSEFIDMGVVVLGTLTCGHGIQVGICLTF